MLGALAVILLKIFKPSSHVGWYSTMVAVCFFSGVIMLFLGMIGEYLGRMFQGLTNNPQYVVRHYYKGKEE
jgi:undecaprenyl-phosphate 4-deoxy-4-formamido-L-arabinose transferase